MAGAAGTLTRSGTFVWEELSTSDVAAARAFYGAVLGWVFDEGAMPSGDAYVMFGPGGKRIGGIFSRPGIPNQWVTYIGVDSADAAAARARELGATVLAGPFDVPKMGRMAVIQDPTGAVIQVWQAVGSEGTPTPPVHGSVAWRELRTNDVASAVRFYEQWLGWTSEPNDMGEFTYHLLSNDGQPVAGAMQFFGGMTDVPPYWAISFNVDDVDAACAAARAAGGTVRLEPNDIEGVGRFASAEDPQGIGFGMMRWADDRG